MHLFTIRITTVLYRKDKFAIKLVINYK